VARTAGAHRKYWYRRAEYGYWTPWEQVKLEIEDNPIIPVLWNSRLFLFWLKILKKTPVDPNTFPTTTDQLGGAGLLTLDQLKSDAQAGATHTAVVDVHALLCWSEYYNGKWQPAKTSDPDRPTYLGTYFTGEDTEFPRWAVRLAPSFDNDAL